MAEHGLSIADLGARGARQGGAQDRRQGRREIPQYGHRRSWSGRGLRPNWLKAALAAGKKLEDFAV